MKYTVIWRPASIEKLADFYLRARTSGHDTGDIRRAASQIDHVLAHDPALVGESRSPGQRVLIVTPLTVTFTVQGDIESQRLSTSTTIGRAGRSCGFAPPQNHDVFICLDNICLNIYNWVTGETG